jgi:hypothetical protein
VQSPAKRSASKPSRVSRGGPNDPKGESLKTDGA